MKHTKFLIFVLYDSITNSIFDGQIAHPLLERKKNNPNLEIIIISFEKKIKKNKLHQIIQPYPSIKFIFLNKIPFLTPITLYPAIRTLHKHLLEYSSYTLIARGPLAGFICLKAAHTTPCNSLTIQARGALMEEYRYSTHSSKNFIVKKIQQWRARQFETIESSVYKKHNEQFPVIIEAVSNALKEYLTTIYKANPKSITLANLDIPTKISADTIQQWRKEIRSQLGIADQTVVYCYNGSLKRWQCPEDTINYFKQQLKIDNNSFLLVLTQDKESFENLLKQHKISSLYYSVLSVPHNVIYHYLAACDRGIIFREKNILNWVSRPTKILEYQAVGLPIIHNDTIALLQE